MGLTVKVDNRRLREYLKEHIRFLEIEETTAGLLRDECWISTEKVGPATLFGKNNNLDPGIGNWIRFIGFSRIDGSPIFIIPDSVVWRGEPDGTKYIYCLTGGGWSIQNKIEPNQIYKVGDFELPKEQRVEEKTIAIKWYKKGKFEYDSKN